MCNHNRDRDHIVSLLLVSVQVAISQKYPCVFRGQSFCCFITKPRSSSRYQIDLIGKVWEAVQVDCAASLPQADHNSSSRASDTRGRTRHSQGLVQQVVGQMECTHSCSCLLCCACCAQDLDAICRDLLTEVN